MAKKLFADGVTGVTAIYNPAVPGALDDPIKYINAVYFHSALDYVSVAAVIDVTATHPKRVKGQKGTLHEYAVPNPASGSIASLNHNLGYKPYALAFVGNNMLPANTQIQTTGSSFRTVAIEVNETSIRIYETAWVYQHDLPALGMSYRVVLFRKILPTNTGKSLFISPTSFIATRGKLNTANNYLRRSTANPMFWFSKGKTADVANGSFKIVTANGAIINRPPYNGNFAGVPGIGVEV